MAEKDPTIRLRRAVKENNLFLVKRLAKRTDLRNPDPTHKRYTSLAWAAALGHEDTFEWLLSAGHDDREISRDSEDNTILIILADARPPVSQLYGTGPPEDEFYGTTLRMARMYFDRYPDTLDWANAEGKTAVHVAAVRGNEELVRMLCDLGADFDLADNEGNTPLHYASAWGHVQIVRELIERGCQYNVRNNDGSTPSDFAYSVSTREALQESARALFESNKKARRNVFAQAAQRGNEWSAQTIVPPPRMSSSSGPRPFNGSARMRSGSGTSRTTTTSDSGEFESPPGMLRSMGLSSSLSPPQHPLPLPQHSQSPTHPSLNSAGSSNGFALPSSTQQGTLAPGPSGALGLSPIASRMRERDAEAMEKYKLRQRSGSAATASTDTPSQSGSTISSGGSNAPSTDVVSERIKDPSAYEPPSLRSLGSVAPRRLLRPSASAAQLRDNPPPLNASTSSQNDTRNRSGTSPGVIRRHPSLSSAPRNIAIDPALITPTQSSTTPTRPPMIKSSSSRDSNKEKDYTGPPSDFARFPPPTFPSETTERDRSHTPTLLSRRLPFNLLSSHKHNGDHHHHHNPFGHKRNSSANSLVSRVT